MVAFESLNPSHRIEAAACLSMRWGDDTPGLYAVPADEVTAYLRASVDQAECVMEQVSDQEALERFAAGAWIGIKAATAGGVAAWVRAIIQPTNN